MPEDPYVAKTNQDLLRECLQTSSPDAWREFVRRVEPVIASSVANVARRYRRSSHEVILDVIQDVFVKLCRDQFKLLKDLRLTHENALFAYLKLAATSMAHDYFRKKRPEAEAVEFLDDAFAAPPSAVTDPAAEEQFLIKEIEQIVEKLTRGPNAGRDRAVFWLHYREGFSASAIAAIPALKLTQKGVESVLHRIRTLLRSQLISTGKENRAQKRVKSGVFVS